MLNAYKDHAFINFDLIFCNNVFQKKNLINIKNFFGKKIKSWKQKILIEKINIKNNIKKKILIAPTWSTNFYDEQIIQHLNKLNNNFDVTFRPHFMSLKNKVFRKFLNKNFNLDQSTQFNLLDYDLLISDWSGIYLHIVHLEKANFN